jgi:single-stranded-DNA-specific exonuclease
MGTVADLVELSGENRLIARHGLLRLAETERPGVHALFQAAGIDFGEDLESADISFRIGPRINAVGRLDDAMVPVEMLLGKNFTQCRRMADGLDALNDERKSIEAGIFEEAVDIIEGSGLAGAGGIVVSQPDWHHGVVGVVASRLTHTYHCPCLVLGAAEAGAGGLRKGSGRGVPGVDLVALLEHCQDLLESWGGHPMAVGLTVDSSRLPTLQARFAEAVDRRYPEGIPERFLEIVDWITPGEITPELLHELDRLRPFGQGNPRPLLGVRPVRLDSPPRIIKGSHFRFQIGNGRSLPVSGIAWNQADRIPPPGLPIEMAVRLCWNVWKGKRNLQLELVDWRPE